MARVSGTAVIMISSPSSDTGHIFNAVMNAFYDDGRPKFLIVNMSICKECRIEGIYDSTKCSHDLQPPEWHGKEQEKDLLRLYEGDEEVAKREFGGKITASDDSVFHEEFVSAFKEQEFYDDHGYTYKVAFTAFDPAGGGGGSDQAIITVGFCGGIATVSQRFFHFSFRHSQARKHRFLCSMEHKSYIQPHGHCANVTFIIDHTIVDFFENGHL